MLLILYIYRAAYCLCVCVCVCVFVCVCMGCVQAVGCSSGKRTLIKKRSESNTCTINGITCPERLGWSKIHLFLSLSLSHTHTHTLTLISLSLSLLVSKKNAPLTHSLKCTSHSLTHSLTHSLSLSLTCRENAADVVGTEYSL